MPASIVIPFNQNPIETSVKTTSYTIPAGKYAKVTPFFNSTPDTSISTSSTGTTSVTVWNCQLDGVIVLKSNASLSFDVSSGADRTFSGPDQHSCVLNLSFTTGNDTAVTYSSRSIFRGSITTGTIQQVFFQASSGASLLVDNIGGTSSGTVSYQYNGNTGISFWVEAGVVLDGSGTFRWLVEEFNVIS